MKDLEHRIPIVQQKEPVVNAEMENKFNVKIADIEDSFTGQFDQLKRQIEERGQPDLSWGKDDFGPLESDKKDGGAHIHDDTFEMSERKPFESQQQVDEAMQKFDASNTFEISQSLDALKQVNEIAERRLSPDKKSLSPDRRNTLKQVNEMSEKRLNSNDRSNTW